jgi:bacillithiol system protein YtxJ
MEWNKINSSQDLQTLHEHSNARTVLVFKHSTRCNISAAALSRIERNWNESENIEPWFLDLLKFRDLSQAIAEKYGVRHESPQALIIRNGECVFSQSHMEINLQEILQHS